MAGNEIYPDVMGEPTPELQHQLDRLERAVEELNGAIGCVHGLGWKVDPCVLMSGGDRYANALRSRGAPSVRVNVSKEFGHR